MPDINATKRKLVAEILEQPTYLPKSGVYLRLQEVLLKLSKDNLGMLKLFISLKGDPDVDDKATHRARKEEAERRAEEEMIRTTCFHCGDPAMPETHGFDPRCERHHDV